MTGDTHQAMKRLGKSLAYERVRQGITAAVMASDLKRSPATISTVENGNNCRLDVVIEMARYLGCDLELRRRDER